MLDTFPYPWPEPWAQQLHITLTRLYPTRAALLTVVERADPDLIYEVDSERAISYAWAEVLTKASVRGTTAAVVTTAAGLLPATSPRRAFLDDLLAQRPVQTDGEPRGAAGEPRFISGTDEVFEPEALLYYDDLTLPIGRVPALIATLERLLLLAPAVCKLTVAGPGGLQEGTGFRIGADLLLTNWHVVHEATAVIAEFGYEDDGAGGVRDAVHVRGDVASIVSDRADDWAVLRTAQPLGDRWPVIDLGSAVTPGLGSPAYVVQHPAGQRKRLGFVRNQVSGFDDRVVHYLTDTEPGSSGSPVFDAGGNLIAVHHAGGRPQEVLGKPPTTKNEGIRIPRITAGLAAAGINLG